MIRIDPSGIRVLGKRWEFAIFVTDANGAPQNLTGGTVSLALGTSPLASTRIVTKTATLQDQTAQTGQALVVFTPSDTTALTLPSTGKFFYQIDVMLDATHIDTIVSGYFRAQPSLI